MTIILLSVNVLLLVIYGWLTHRHQQWVNRTLREDIERLNQDRRDLHDRIDNINDLLKVMQENRATSDEILERKIESVEYGFKMLHDRQFEN